MRTIYGQLMAITSVVLGAAVFLSLLALFVMNVLHAPQDTRHRLLAQLPVVVEAVRRQGPAGAGGRLAVVAREVGGGVAVYDASGRLLAHRGRLPPATAVRDAAMDLELGRRLTDWHDVHLAGRRVLVALYPMFDPASGRELLIAADAPVRPQALSVRQTAPVLVAGVLALILAQLLWSVVIRRFTRPLEAITAWAGRLAAGDLGARLQVGEGVAELRTLGDALARMAGALAAESERREAFLAEVAHDLRTPLSVQRTLLRTLARREGAPEEVPRLAARAQAETERLIRLVNGLLDMARLEAGQPLGTRSRIDLREPVAMAAAAFEPAARERGVRLEVDLGAEPLPVLADPDRVTEIATNLLDNALRHAGDGGEVRVRAGADRAAGRASVGVSDSGPGVSPAVLDTLWERFGATGDGRVRGGLGLAISRALARAMEGELELLPGRPTTFVLTLPLARN